MSSISRSYSYGEAAPDGLYTGTRAQTVQFYPEANVKNGLQYYIREAWPKANAIGSGETKNLYFKTGGKKVIAKVRIIHYAAEEILLNILTGSDVDESSGSSIAPSNYNLINPVPTAVVVRKDVTFAGGTPIDNGEYYFGSNANAQRDGNSIPEGRERIIPPVGDFVITLKNTGSGTARVQYFLDWYEGEPDLPRPE